VRIIEAMRKIKDNNVKISDLHVKIAQNSANLESVKTEYGDRTGEMVASWVQSCLDLTQESARLGIAIQKTNIHTNVTIELGGKQVTKSIAEWVLRRRLYANIDESTYRNLTDKRLQPQAQQSSNNGLPVVTVFNVVLNYDPVVRDTNIAVFREEPSKINAALEIVNATTDLIED
jgi:hypothetical protein